MVRVMTATLVKVGEGAIEPEEVEKILKERDRRKAPFLAPPDGLYLEKVYYENYPFSSKKEVI
jgi:tRNA pseudouridine38-40 synthase